MDKGEKILKIIEKFENLEKGRKRYSNAIRHLPFWKNDHRWSKNDQRYINKIEFDLVELWDCILRNTQWSKERIERAIQTTEPDPRERLIQEFKLIRRRLEVESQPEQSKPAETEQKEIVEVKPGAFGITVNIKELARRFWKWVCSRNKD